MNTTEDNIQNNVRLCMETQVMGAVKVERNLHEYLLLKIVSTVEVYETHLENQQNIISNNKKIHVGELSDSPQMIYFKKLSTSPTTHSFITWSRIEFMICFQKSSSMLSQKAHMVMDLLL